jgi:hypothetical protein
MEINYRSVVKSGILISSWSLGNNKSLIVEPVCEYWFGRITRVPLCLVHKYFSVTFTGIFCSERQNPLCPRDCQSAPRICDPSTHTSYAVDFKITCKSRLTTEDAVTGPLSVTGSSNGLEATLRSVLSECWLLGDWEGLTQWCSTWGMRTSVGRLGHAKGLAETSHWTCTINKSIFRNKHWIWFIFDVDYRLCATWIIHQQLGGTTFKCNYFRGYVKNKTFNTTSLTFNLRFSRRWLWTMASSEILRRVTLVRIDLSEELSASIIRVTRIAKLGT